MRMLPDPSPSLRVAVIATSLNLAGAEKQTFYLTRALHQAGAGVRFYHLGGDGHYETCLRQAGVDFHRIYSPDRPVSILARLNRSLRRWRPQIILVPQFGDLRFAVPSAHLGRALVVGGIRSDGFYELNRYGRWSPWLIRLTHGLIANSCRARQNLVSQEAISPEKIEVLPNVIDLPDFDRDAGLPFEVPLPAGRIIAAAVGNLHACKRFDRFLIALALARRYEPALAGVIAGADGGVRAELETQAKALDLTPNDLVFLGRCHQVPALLARSAMLVLTSDYEGFPNVILEAMAARLPVISVPAGDAGLIVEPDRTGFIVEANDLDGMARCMLRLAQSPAMRKRLGEAGRKRAEQEYSCETLAHRLTAIFHRFATRQKRRALCELIEHGVPAKPSGAFAGGAGVQAMPAV